MKRLLITWLTFLVLTDGAAQSTEVRVSLNSGLFSFAGQSAREISFLSYFDQSKTGSTNNPYGTKSGLSYGLSVNLKRISNRMFIKGVDFGYEVLASKVAINEIVRYTTTSMYQVNATGKTNLNFSCINLHPFIGYRIGEQKVKVDLTTGLDFAYLISATEKGDATDANGAVYTTSSDRLDRRMDIRPRFQLAAEQGRYGFYVGYSFGFLSYLSGYVGGPADAVSRMWRFGISYKIK